MTTISPSKNRLILLSQAAGLALAAIVVVVYAIHGSMPHNALRLPAEEKFETAVVLPEVWAFFTRSPREPRFLVYSRHEDGSWAQAIGVQSDAAEAFGLRRTVRALNLEAGAFMMNIKDEDWTPCPSGTPSSCLDKMKATKPMTNVVPEPTFCGDVAIVQQDRVPWAWATHADPNTMPSKIVRMVVKC
jgi:antimicrobial peptide system SdpA family protein